jgi:hypothetical protein
MKGSAAHRKIRVFLEGMRCRLDVAGLGEIVMMNLCEEDKKLCIA